VRWLAWAVLWVAWRIVLRVALVLVFAVGALSLLGYTPKTAPDIHVGSRRIYQFHAAVARLKRPR
jgi:hypothetical protein